jgi:hypothetical protein
MAYLEFVDHVPRAPVLRAPVAREEEPVAAEAQAT